MASRDMPHPRRVSPFVRLALFAAGLGGGLLLVWRVPATSGYFCPSGGVLSWRTGMLLWAGLMWATIIPAMTSLQIVRRPHWALAMPAAACAVALVSWLMLDQGVVPGPLRRMLALSDSAGPPALPPPGALALHGGMALTLMLGIALMGQQWFGPWKAAARSIPAMLLLNAPWVVLAGLVAMGAADPKAQCLRGAPLPGVACAFMLTLLAGAHSMILARALRERTLRRIAWAILATVTILPLGYWLLALGLTSAAPAQCHALAGAGLGLGASDLARLTAWCATQFLLTAALAGGNLVVVAFLPDWGHACGPTKGQEQDAGGGPRASASAIAVRWYAVLAIAYAAFVTYGMLVPLEFHYVPLTEAIERYLKAPFLRMGLYQRADWVANGLLFVPLTFLAMGALTRAAMRSGQGTLGLFVAAGAIALAFVTEFLQIYFPPRTVSLNDILAECIGGAAGVIAWLCAGRLASRWAARLRATASPRRLAVAILTGYAAALVFYQLMPFDFVLSGKELTTKFIEGKVHLVPFSDLGRMSVPRMTLTTAALLPCGYLLALLIRHRRRTVLATALGLLTAMVLENLDLFIYSRAATATDVFLGAAGAAAGAWIADYVGPPARRRLPCPRALAGLAAGAAAIASVVLAACVVKSRWDPYDFRWPAEGLGRHLWASLHVPFYAQYFNTEFGALTQLMGVSGSMFLLGLLLAGSLYDWRRGRSVAMLAAGAFGAVVDAGRLLLPSRVFDATTLAFAVAGAVAGAAFCRSFIRIFIQSRGATGGMGAMLPGSFPEA